QGAERPRLVPVDDPPVAAALGARRDPGRLRARLALGHAEGLQADLAARELRQPPLLLRVGAVPQQRAHRVHLRVARAGVAAGRVDLLEDDGRLLEAEAAAAVLGRDQ